MIAVARTEGQFFAIEDICTHDGAELAGGEIEGTEIICPRHGARFCQSHARVSSFMVRSHASEA